MWRPWASQTTRRCGSGAHWLMLEPSRKPIGWVLLNCTALGRSEGRLVALGRLAVQGPRWSSGVLRALPTPTLRPQSELGDVVYVELPEVGATVTKGETYGVVESVKVINPNLPGPSSANQPSPASPHHPIHQSCMQHKCPTHTPPSLAGC